MFEAEFLLWTATGVGWDPIEKKPMCTDQYWQQFVTSHPEVERARRKPLPDFDLYLCAFVNSRATGVNEYDQDETPITPSYPPEPIPGSLIDIDGGSQRYNDTCDTSYTEMRHGVSVGGRTPHVASQSHLNNKRSSVEKETSQDKCIDLLGELDIPQDQYLFMFNYLNAHATLHRPFLRMKEHHRLAWIQQTMEQHANQQVSSPPPTFTPGSHYPFQSSHPMNQHFSHTFHPSTNTFQPSTSNFQPYMPPNFPPYSARDGRDSG
ncbi:hypothetical protein L484_004446 [Morus notabilis]|uniref:Myb/SANT-like domain-containing protein n=1 Tax=Morus notabilis TaxID=981085 RepID=W9RXA4_9ROSA|nr:hypothetical protein L484_004446 [Morus notabilis]